ncbi:MAG: hypothetical protein ACRDPC_26500 [Solirubrobacteraceae bacterium]
MATTPATPDRRAETRAFLRAARERNAERRENVLRQAATLRRISEALRARRR